MVLSPLSSEEVEQTINAYTKEREENDEEEFKLSIVGARTVDVRDGEGAAGLMIIQKIRRPFSKKIESRNPQPTARDCPLLSRSNLIVVHPISITRIGEPIVCVTSELLTDPLGRIDTIHLAKNERQN